MGKEFSIFQRPSQWLMSKDSREITNKEGEQNEEPDTPAKKSEGQNDEADKDARNKVVSKKNYKFVFVFRNTYWEILTEKIKKLSLILERNSVKTHLSITRQIQSLEDYCSGFCSRF